MSYPKNPHDIYEGDIIMPLSNVTLRYVALKVWSTGKIDFVSYPDDGVQAPFSGRAKDFCPAPENKRS